MNGQVHTALFAECGHNKTRLVLSRATGRAHHLNLVLGWARFVATRAEETSEHFDV